MNLDDLLKSIRDEDDDSKGGKDLDDLLESIREEDTKIDPNKLFSTKKFTNPLVGQRFTAPGIKPNLPKSQTLEPVVVNVDPEKLIPQDESKNEEIIEKLNELIEVIKDDNALEEARQDYEKKIESEEKRKEREKRIEVGKIFGINRTVDKVIKKSQSIFDSLIKFLAFTVLGQIVKLVTDFLRDPKNKEFIDNTINFIKSIPDRLREVRDKLIPVIDWFKEQGPKIARFAEDFRKLLVRFPFLGQYFATEEEKQQGIETVPGTTLLPGQGVPLPSTGPSGIPMIIPMFAAGGMMTGMGTDTIPAMLTPGEFVMSRGAVNMFGVDTMMAMNKAAGGTNRPKFGLVSGFSGGGFTRDVTKLLENYEGLRLNAYPDPASGGEPITIGVGATRYPPGFRFGRSKVMLGDTITKEEAYMIKDYDVKRHTQIAKERVGHDKWPKIPENVKSALISKAFNYGTVYDSTLRELDKGIESGDYSALAFHFRNVLAKHNSSINSWRRNDEADIIEKGKSSRSGISFTADLSAPSVMPPPSMPGGTVKSNSSPDSSSESPVNNRFGGVNLDFIFKPLRQFLGVDTPNAPTSTKIIVLPPIKQQAKQPTTTQTSNEIPDFRVSSGVQMRGLVKDALGIGDYVS